MSETSPELLQRFRDEIRFRIMGYSGRLPLTQKFQQMKTGRIELTPKMIESHKQLMMLEDGPPPMLVLQTDKARRYDVIVDWHRFSAGRSL